MSNFFNSLPKWQRFTFIVLFGVFSLSFLAFISELIAPVMIALFFSYLLIPLVDRIEFFVQKRILAVVTLYIAVLFAVIVFFNYFIPILLTEFNELTLRFPFYAYKIQEWSFLLRDNVERSIPFLQRYNIFDSLQLQVQDILLGLAQRIPTIFLSTFSTLSSALLIPVILFFFLLEGPEFKKSFFQLIPNKYFETSMYLFYSIGNKLGNYLRGIFLETLIIGILTVTLLLGLNVDYAVLLGTVAAIMNIIPYLGPVIGAIPALIVIYLKFKSFQILLYLVIGYLVIQSLDNIVLKPIIYSQSVDLHPLSILFFLLIGGMMAGVWGLILAVPVAGILKVTISILIQEIKFRIRMTESSS